MNNWHQLKIPPREHLEVQILDGTQQHNIVKVITSLAAVRGDQVSYLFKLYQVLADGSLKLLAKNPKEPTFQDS